MSKENKNRRLTLTVDQWDLVLISLEKWIEKDRKEHYEDNLNITQPLHDKIQVKVNKRVENINVNETELTYIHFAIYNDVAFHNGDIVELKEIAIVVEKILREEKWNNINLKFSYQWNDIIKEYKEQGLI